MLFTIGFDSLNIRWFKNGTNSVKKGYPLSIIHRRAFSEFKYLAGEQMDFFFIYFIPNFTALNFEVKKKRNIRLRNKMKNRFWYSFLAQGYRMSIEFHDKKQKITSRTLLYIFPNTWFRPFVVQGFFPSQNKEIFSFFWYKDMIPNKAITSCIYYNAQYYIM